MNQINMSPKEFKCKTVAIVKFGPATVTSGFRPGEYFQVTVDPMKVSPSGEYIRFGMYPGDEIQGWQRVDALTILETLGEWDGDTPPIMTIGANGVTLLAVG